MAAYSPDRPVSPLKNTAWRGPRTTMDDHSVLLRVFMVRPLKCCDGAAVMVRPVLGTVQAVPPVQLVDALGRDAPGLQVRPRPAR
jgi:hypothetical protein